MHRQYNQTNFPDESNVGHTVKHLRAVNISQLSPPLYNNFSEHRKDAKGKTTRSCVHVLILKNYISKEKRNNKNKKQNKKHVGSL